MTPPPLHAPLAERLDEENRPAPDSDLIDEFNARIEYRRRDWRHHAVELSHAHVDVEDRARAAAAAPLCSPPELALTTLEFGDIATEAGLPAVGMRSAVRTTNADA